MATMPTTTTSTTTSTPPEVDTKSPEDLTDKDSQTTSTDTDFTTIPSTSSDKDSSTDKNTVTPSTGKDSSTTSTDKDSSNVENINVPSFSAPASASASDGNGVSTVSSSGNNLSAGTAKTTLNTKDPENNSVSSADPTVQPINAVAQNVVGDSDNQPIAVAAGLPEKEKEKVDLGDISPNNLPVVPVAASSGNSIERFPTKPLIPIRPLRGANNAVAGPPRGSVSIQDIQTAQLSPQAIINQLLSRQ